MTHWFRILTVLCAALAAGCTQSDLEVVQRAPMPGNTAQSIAQTLGRIPSCKKVTWLESTREGRPFVTASCPIAELYGVRENIGSRLRTLEQDALKAFEGRKAERAERIRTELGRERAVREEIGSRIIIQKQARVNVRAGGVSDCSYFERMMNAFEQSRKADEKLIADECAKGEVECSAAKAVYEPRLAKYRERIERLSGEQSECRAEKDRERERVKSLNEQYAASAREERERAERLAAESDERIAALEKELRSTLEASEDEALARDMAAIAALRPAAGLEKLTVEFEFEVIGRDESRTAQVSSFVSEFVWKGADPYGVQHGGRGLSRYSSEVLLRDVNRSRSLWDCLTSPASELSCRDLSEEILTVFRERFSLSGK